MPLPTLYVSRLLTDPVMTAIRTRFTLLSEPTPQAPSHDSLIDGLREAEAAIVTLTETITGDVLRTCRRLKVLANHAVGFNNIDLAAAKAAGIVVTNTPDVLTEATADLTWALLLAVARRVTEGHRLVQDDRWTGWEPTQLLGADVAGRTLGIVGMGRIGQAVARRAAGFAMPVLYASRHEVPFPSATQAWTRASLDELLDRSDFVSLHVPLTPDTHHLIGRTAFEAMRQTAIFLNTSRGPVVDEAALAEALQHGLIAGAGLDVYEQEPRIHPSLLGLPQVVTLPHLGSATQATRDRMGFMCVDNVSAVLEGRPVAHRVA